MDELKVKHLLEKSLEAFLNNGKITFPPKGILNNMSVISIPMDIKENRLYRVRDFYSFSHNDVRDNIFSVRSFSYAPKGVGKLNRASNPMYPLFYAASTPNLAVEECKLTNNLFYISSWSIRGKINIRPFLSNIPKDILNDPLVHFKSIKERMAKLGCLRL